MAASLREVAAANATMPDALVDDINELATDAIGDIIIDPVAQPPAIVEESVEAVHSLLAAVR